MQSCLTGTVQQSVSTTLESTFPVVEMDAFPDACPSPTYLYTLLVLRHMNAFSCIKETGAALKLDPLLPFREHFSPCSVLGPGACTGKSTTTHQEIGQGGMQMRACIACTVTCPRSARFGHHPWDQNQPDWR